MTKGASKYDDIVNLPHHVSTRHPRMSMGQRAAQFAPFAALTGYDDSVRAAARNNEINGPDTESYSAAEDMP